MAVNNSNFSNINNVFFFSLNASSDFISAASSPRLFSESLLRQGSRRGSRAFPLARESGSINRDAAFAKTYRRLITSTGRMFASYSASATPTIASFYYAARRNNCHASAISRDVHQNKSAESSRCARGNFVRSPAKGTRAYPSVRPSAYLPTLPVRPSIYTITSP